MLALDSKRPVTLPTVLSTVPGWTRIVTPMIVETWDRLLEMHPDMVYRRYLVKGISEGFRIGFNYGYPLTSLGEISLLTTLLGRPDQSLQNGPIPTGHFFIYREGRFELVPSLHHASLLGGQGHDS